MVFNQNTPTKYVLKKTIPNFHKENSGSVYDLILNRG